MNENKEFTLVGVDGNAFSVMGYVLRCMKTCKKSLEEQHNYTADAMSSDYNHLLAVSCEMIDKLNEERNSKSEMCECDKESDF